MDKYEYKLKTEQMLEFMDDGDYVKAAEIADEIDWRRVRNVSMLINVSNLYEKNENYKKSYKVMQEVYKRASGGRKVVYRLGILALKLEQVDEAIDYYDEFVQLAPKDPNQYILKYKILRAQKAPVEQQIQSLEEFKKAEYIEKWAFELAKCYEEAGMTAECLEECDDLILWFSEGDYVYQAMELKKKYKPLTASQQEKYNRRNASAEKTDKKAASAVPAESAKAAEKAPEEAVAVEEPVAAEEPIIKKVSAIATSMPLEAAINSLVKGVAPEATASGEADSEEIPEEQIEGQMNIADILEDNEPQEAAPKTEKESSIPDDIQRILDEVEQVETGLEEDTADELTETVITETEVEAETEAVADEVAVEEEYDEKLVDYDEENSEEDEDDDLNKYSQEDEQEIEDDLEEYDDEDDDLDEYDEDLEEYDDEDDDLDEYDEEDEDLEEYEDEDDDLDEYDEEDEDLEEYDDGDDDLDEYDEEDEDLEEYDDEDDDLDEYDEEDEDLEGYEDGDDDLDEYDEEDEDLEEYDDEDEVLEDEDEEEELPDLLASTAPLSRKETAKMIATGKTAPLPIDEISDALSISDTGFIVHGRYDLETQSGVGTRAGLTEEQKKLFSYFVPVRGMSEQLVDVLEQDKNCTNRKGTSNTGNLLIIGRKGSGKTVLAVDVVKAIQRQRNIRQGKVAIVTGDALNRKKLSDIMDKLYGGALIIEKAGKMNERTVAKLNKAMEKDTGEMLIVLEEQRKPLDRLLSSNKEFRRKFTSRLEVPIFINDELVTFGQTYARENGYRIDEMGILALYSRIDALQREDHAVTVAEVKEVMDEAIEHSQKASAKKLVKRVFGRGTDSSDRILLSEKDFNI